MDRPFRCLGCGTPTSGPDRFAVCDACLDGMEEQLLADRLAREILFRLRAGRAQRLRSAGPPQDVADEQVRRLLDSW